MGYCVEDDVVRVDVFKSSGKWSHTVAMKWTGGWSKDNYIHDAFRESLEDYVEINSRGSCKLEGYSKGTTFICLEPYHELSHPLSLTIK